jgi:hypothetical protein
MICECGVDGPLGAQNLKMMTKQALYLGLMSITYSTGTGAGALDVSSSIASRGNALMRAQDRAWMAAVLT